MKMEKESDDSSNRRSFLRKLATAAAAGLAGLMLNQERLKPVNAATCVSTDISSAPEQVGLVGVSGLAKAGAVVECGGTLIRGFNNLPGGKGPTVTQIAFAEYEVDFGVDISSRFFLATGAAQGFDPGGSWGQIVCVNRSATRNSAVHVQIKAASGWIIDSTFYLLIF